MTALDRRSLIRGLGLGATATLLSPLCQRLIRDARGQPAAERRLVLLTTNNGFAHESDDDHVTDATPIGKRSKMFDIGYTSASEFTLPAFLQPISTHKDKLSIWFGLENYLGSYDGVPHGSGPSTLTARPMAGEPGGDIQPTGVSIDRFIGGELQRLHADFIKSTNVSTLLYGQYASSESADDAGKRTDTYTTPLKAYIAYFGAAAQLSPQEAEARLARDQSLLDAMAKDIQVLQGKLAGYEREKLDQMLTSTRELEQKLSKQASSLPKGKPTPPSIDDGDLKQQTITAFLDITWQVQAYGLTHVSHFALHGTSTESDTRRPLVPEITVDDTHNALFHGALGEAQTFAEISALNRYLATQYGYLHDSLAKIASGAGTLADETLVVWMNSGGLAHHRGHYAHPIILLGDLGGVVRAPYFGDFTRHVELEAETRLRGTRHVADAFVSLANAFGLPITTFGEPSVCKGPLPGVLNA